MFDAVLVANRGEIAVRIMRTLRALGVRSVAVFSDADRDALHVEIADDAVHVGPPPAIDSYLDVDRIVDAAVRSGAAAIHPGYGFLSENVALARACEEAGLVFVGPPVAAIEAMGDKIRAKQTVAANDVRVVPGISGAGLHADELVAAAVELGVPALIKPSAGGGGKGMRLVTDAARFAEEIAAAQREARGAFGDDTLLIERYIDRPRHIEVQVLADAHGGIVHLGERECSLQRRHQKVIEEAPSPFLTDEQRQRLGQQAIAAARACGYVNAGTVEFIVSGECADEAYFMEMNTRLQVEHPVTEMVWGIDLVEQQLRIAAGEPLPFTQDDLAPSGHAFEARVYAEDTDNGFLPTGGVVVGLREAECSDGVRVDSSLRVGTAIGSEYDPMLSKVIAWGEHRDAARRRIVAALSDTVVFGVTTNVGFLRSMLEHPDVAAGALDTGLVERVVGDRPSPASPPLVAAVAAWVLLDRARHGGAWGDRRGWRIGPPAPISSQLVDAAGGALEVVLIDRGPTWQALIGGETVSFVAERSHDEVRVDADGSLRRFALAIGDEDVWLGADGATWNLHLARPEDRRRTTGDHHGLTLVSPMPGTVVAVNVAVGDLIEAGQPIVVVEAMKMEHTLRAAAASTVVEVAVRVGDRVDLRQPLVTLDQLDDTVSDDTVREDDTIRKTETPT